MADRALCAVSQLRRSVGEEFGGKRLRAYFSSNLGGTLTLVHALQNDTDELVRHYTAFSLGRIGSPEAIPSLIHALRSDSSDEVRSHAAEALNQLMKKGLRFR
jgi:HEAT repeat protein